jgi:putative hemolysin
MATPLSSLYLELIFFVISLVACAIFSFLETSVTALRLFKLKELAQSSTGRYGQLFLTLEKDPHRVLITILIASSLADVTAAALSTHIMETIFAYFNFSGGLGFSAGIALATMAILIFGEVIPKNIAKAHGEKLFRSSLWLTNIVFYLMYPFVTLLTRLSDFVIYRLSGGKLADGTESVTSEKEIKFLIDYIDEHGLMEREKTQMLQNIFELGRTPVREIMVPTTDIVSISSDMGIEETFQIFSKYQYSRLPIFQGKIDNVIGMVHQKDLFLIWSKHEDKTLKDIMRPILFIPESVKVNQLLREFRQQHMHIAIVINEFGGVTGLVTLEDVLEEIVGEINDEYEPTSEKVVPLKQGGWLVDAAITLEELQELLHMSFETESALTLGGFLTEQLQHLPKKGERVLYKKHYFQIQKASAKRVFQVLIFEEKTNEPSL